MTWEVRFTKGAQKGVEKLRRAGRRAERERLLALVGRLETDGPVRKDFPNYSPLGPTEHHCHLGHSWVACWRVEGQRILIEVYYVGSREDAPY